MTYCSKWKLPDSIPEAPSHRRAHRKHPFATQITPTYGTNTANLTPSVSPCVCVCVCLPPFSDFPRFPHSPRFPWPASMSMPTCQSFYENVKVSNSLELRWECLTVHKCPTLDLHKYFARQPENGVGKADGKVGGNREGVGCGVMEHVWWALEKLSKMRKVKQTSAPPLPFYRFQFSISHCWAFSAFHGCHFVSRAVEKFPPRFLLFLTCFSLFFRPVCLFFNIFFFFCEFASSQCWNHSARKSLNSRVPNHWEIHSIHWMGVTQNSECFARLTWVGDFWETGCFGLISIFSCCWPQKQLLTAANSGTLSYVLSLLLALG